MRTQILDHGYIEFVESWGSDERIIEAAHMSWLADLDRLYAHAQLVCESGISFGVPKELARLAVPVARYSRMRASADLRNWLGFLALRQASNAQWEIRQYTDAVFSLVEQLFPRTAALFAEGR